MAAASFTADAQNQRCNLQVSGEWRLGNTPDSADLCAAIPPESTDVVVHLEQLESWDSSLASALLQLANWCESQQKTFAVEAAPEGLNQLLNLATGVPAHKPVKTDRRTGFSAWLQKRVANLGHGVYDTLTFIGDTCLALGRWFGGKAKTRRSDIIFFIDQAGPQALGIVTLISVLVGMILAYLGSVQLRQLGAQVYVADLVAIGMVREMGALMTAVIMAGRTGAAYAAQIGTMQVNDEVDALRVMGISSMEFLVVPRLVALVFVMPLLCIYADIIGIAGGAIIASSMDVSFVQYILQTRGAVDWLDISTGLIKAVVFGVLIAIAGCQAGLQCGRNSNAVGMAATNAVVRAIVYLVVADAALNVLYDKLGI
jgi:phospholipid/cholesterol/gamma-HCH transport system permease protein